MADATLGKNVTICAPGVANGAYTQPSAAAHGNYNQTPQQQATPMAIRGEVALWNAVLLQQVLDAKSTNPKIRYERMAALTWLNISNLDFRMVCEYAGLCPFDVAAKLRAASARDFAWRLPNGQGWRTQGTRRTPEPTQ